MVDTAVLIVEVGPTGRIVAHELLRRGISCRPVDKRPASQSSTRAFTGNLVVPGKVAIHNRHDFHAFRLWIATAKPLHAAMARRALLRLDTMATSHPRPLGVPRSELPRLCPARLPRCPLQTILR